MEHWTMRVWAQRGGWRVEWVFKLCSSGSDAAFIDCSRMWTFSLISPNLWVLAEKDRQTKHHITMQDWTGTTKEAQRAFLFFWLRWSLPRNYHRYKDWKFHCSFNLRKNQIQTPKQHGGGNSMREIDHSLQENLHWRKNFTFSTGPFGA